MVAKKKKTSSPCGYSRPPYYLDPIPRHQINTAPAPVNSYSTRAECPPRFAPVPSGLTTAGSPAMLLDAGPPSNTRAGPSLCLGSHTPRPRVTTTQHPRLVSLHRPDLISARPILAAWAMFSAIPAVGHVRHVETDHHRTACVAMPCDAGDSANAGDLWIIDRPMNNHGWKAQLPILRLWLPPRPVPANTSKVRTCVEPRRSTA